MWYKVLESALEDYATWLPYFVTKDQLDARTVAHELGHGAFALRHTFSEKNVVSLPQGKTDNLMDYTPDKNALLKAQWDLIHNPENVQFAWTEEMEEGAMIYGITWLGDIMGLAK